MSLTIPKTIEPASINSCVLVVDDEQSVCDVLAAILEVEGYTVITANSGSEAMSLFGEYIFDVMYTDICMDGMNGLELLERVTHLDKTIKTIVMTAFSGYDTAVKALKGGAFDYIEKPFDEYEKVVALTHKARQFAQLERDNVELLTKLKLQHTKLQAANKKLAHLNIKLEEQAITDSLTGLHNRRFIDTIHEQECARYLRHMAPFTVALIDVDNFKQYNDQYGHIAGDIALQSISRQLLECTRDADTVGRYGGEEFYILLRNTSPINAVNVAERILNSVRKLVIKVDGIETKLSVSIGLAGLDGNEAITTGINLIEQSDKALYYAKSQGRDQFKTFTNNQLGKS